MLKSILIVVLGLIFAFSGTMLGSETALAQDTLNISYNEDPESLDVHRAPSLWVHHFHIFDTLVVICEDGEYHGGLAEDWEFKEGDTVVTFHLRDDVTFHDGTEFNAEAVKFNFERLLDPDFASPHRDVAGPITDIIVEDEYTITFEYEEPVATLLYDYSQYFLGIQSPTAIEEYGDDYGVEAAVGTGPYQLARWDAGEQIVLERFEDYTWAPDFYDNPGPANIERVVFENMPDEMTILLALRQGNIDIGNIPTPYIETFKADERVEVDLAPPGQVTYLGINSSKAPWDDPRLRRAVAHTIDREEIVEVALNGFATPHPLPLAPGVLGHNEDLYELAPERDIESGKELLREAGYTETSNGWVDEEGEELVLNIWTYATDAMSRLAEVTREQIIQLGIEVEIETLESATLLGRTPEGEHDSVLIGYGWSDPGILTSFLHSDNLDTSNRVHYVNPELDELLEKAGRTVDPEERFEVVQEIQKIILEECPWIPLYTEDNALGINPDLQGLRRSPGGAHPRLIDAHF